MSSTIQEKKVVLLGSGGSGKTTFVQEFFCMCFPMLGIQKFIHKIREDLIINFFDIINQSSFNASKEAFYSKTDAFLIFFRSDSEHSLNSVFDHIKVAKLFSPEAKILVVCNDFGTKVNREKIYEKLETYNVSFVDANVKTKENLNKIFQFVSEDVSFSILDQQEEEQIKNQIKQLITDNNGDTYQVIYNLLKRIS